MKTPNPAKPYDYSLNINGLRGFAAAMVFLFHVYDMARKIDVLPEYEGWINAALLSLSCGVDLFFMISGYLIMGSLVRHARIRDFLADRVIRIYPVFLFLHILLFMLAPLIHYKWLAGISPGMWGVHFISNLLLLPGVFDLPLLQLNAWSLSYELAFYLFSSLVCFLWPRMRPAALALLFLALPVLLWLHFRAAFFVVGAAVFFLVDRNSDLMKQWPKTSVLAFAPFIALMGIIYGYDMGYLIFPAVFLGFCVFMDIVRGCRAYDMVLRNRKTQFLGKISYSFYLWHPVVMFPLKKVMGVMTVKYAMSPFISVGVFGICSFALTVTVSYISYLWLEQKAGKWLRHAYLARQTAALTAH